MWFYQDWTAVSLDFKAAIVVVVFMILVISSDVARVIQSTIMKEIFCHRARLAQRTWRSDW